MNLYEYVGGDAATSVDPLGMIAQASASVTIPGSGAGEGARNFIKANGRYNVRHEDCPGVIWTEWRWADQTDAFETGEAFREAKEDAKRKGLPEPERMVVTEATKKRNATLEMGAVFFPSPAKTS